MLRFERPLHVRPAPSATPVGPPAAGGAFVRWRVARVHEAAAPRRAAGWNRPARRRAAGGRGRLLLLVGVLASLAQPVSAQINNCIPPTGRGSSVGALDDLRGSLLLVAYATAGAKQGRITSGTVDLMAAPPQARARGVLLIGATSIDLARIGGEFAGSLRSRDPGSPSVTLEGPRDGAPATLTFGSVRARRANGDPSVPVVRFEILERYGKGVRGRWRTVGGSSKAGSGHFCASRF